MRQAKLIKPIMSRYEKTCTKCGKNFTCNGVCGKDEEYKKNRVACFCNKCYVKTFGKSFYHDVDDSSSCPSRFGKDANPLYLVKVEIKPEKVIFT